MYALVSTALPGRYIDHVLDVWYFKVLAEHGWLIKYRSTSVLNQSRRSFIGVEQLFQIYQNYTITNSEPPNCEHNSNMPCFHPTGSLHVPSRFRTVKSLVIDVQLGTPLIDWCAHLIYQIKEVLSHWDLRPKAIIGTDILTNYVYAYITVFHAEVNRGTMIHRTEIFCLALNFRLRYLHEWEKQMYLAFK